MKDGLYIYNNLPEGVKEAMRDLARCVIFAHSMKPDDAASAFDALVNWYDAHPEMRED